MDTYDPEGFRAAGHALIDQLADHVARAGRSAVPVLDFAPARVTLERSAEPETGACAFHAADRR